MQYVDRAGTFRAEITEYRLLPTKPGKQSVNVAIKARLLQYWGEGEDGEMAWFDWAEYEMTVDGIINLVTNDGVQNEWGIKSMTQHLGWDQDLMSIQGHAWQPEPCQVVVKADTRANRYSEFTVAFVNGYDDEPRSGGQEMDADAAKALQTRYGAQFRAIGGNAKRNAKPPAGKPAAPPKPAPGISNEEARATAEQADDIPF